MLQGEDGGGGPEATPPPPEPPSAPQNYPVVPYHPPPLRYKPVPRGRGSRRQPEYHDLLAGPPNPMSLPGPPSPPEPPTNQTSTSFEDPDEDDAVTRLRRRKEKRDRESAEYRERFGEPFKLSPWDEEEKEARRQQREEEKRQRDEDRRQREEDRKLKKQQRDEDRQMREEQRREAREEMLLKRSQQAQEKFLREEQRKVELVHDPYYNAKERRRREQERALDEEAYRDLYGEDEQRSGMDALLEVANSLRGTIGGIFGPIVGSALDLMRGVRRAEIAARKQRKHERLLQEAEGDLTPEVPTLEEVPEIPTLELVPEPEPPTVEAVPEENPFEINVPQGLADKAHKSSPGKVNTPPPTVPPIPPARAAGGGAGGAGGGAGGIGAAGAGGLGGAGGSMAGIAAAAGPIALAVAVGNEINKATQAAIKSAASTATTLATTVASANADPAIPIEKLGDAATSAGEKLGGFGHGLVIVGEQFKALSSIMQAVNQTAGRYGEYSPEIAQAQAVAEIRQTMGDFRRAQVVSAEMSKFVMAQSDLQQRVEDVKVKILTKMLPLVTRAVEMVEVIVAGGEDTVKAIEILAQPLTLLSQAASELVGMKRDERMPDPEDPTTQILNPKFFEAPEVGGWAPDR